MIQRSKKEKRMLLNQIPFNKLRKSVGLMEWQQSKHSGMLFMASECNGKVRLQFAIKIPFAASFQIYLSKIEAIKLSDQLHYASEEVKPTPSMGEEIK
jgi:hypothetical protein